MALEQSEEYGPDGLLKAKYGDCFIRGNNGKGAGVEDTTLVLELGFVC